MTREEALNKAIGILTYNQVNFCKSKEAVANMNEIIEALEKIDQEQCGDCISREAVVNKLDYLCDCLCEYSKKQRSSMCGACKLGSVFDALDDLPSVTPQPKMGRWIDIMVGDMPAQACDQCNTFYPLAYTGGGHKYCPNCGAKMSEIPKGEEGSEKND